MIRIRHVKKHYGSLLCRKCLNRKYGANLQPRNCIYLKEIDICPVCEDKKKLVRRLTLIGYIRTIGKKRIPRSALSPEQSSGEEGETNVNSD